MSRFSREQLVTSGALAFFLALTGLAGGDNQPSVAHAALNLLNNRPSERVLMQTIPAPTEYAPTLAPTPVQPPTVEATFTPTPPSVPTEAPTLTPTPELPGYTTSEIGAHLTDAENLPLADLPIYVRREIPAGIIAVNTDNFGSINQIIQNGQTAEIFTQGPNSIADARYALTTNSSLFNTVTVAHEEGEHLATSMEFSTDVNPATRNLAQLTEITPTPTTSGGNPIATETPTPTPIIDLPLNFIVDGGVTTDTISIGISPDDIEVEVTDFDSAGSITFNSPDATPLNRTNTSAAGTTTENYEVTIFSAAPDADGFTLSVTTGGSSATTEIESTVFSSGELMFNTSEVAQAIANQQDGIAQLPVTIDYDNDGTPDQEMTLPADTIEDSADHVLFLPLIHRQVLYLLNALAVASLYGAVK